MKKLEKKWLKWQKLYKRDNEICPRRSHRQRSKINVMLKNFTLGASRHHSGIYMWTAGLHHTPMGLKKQHMLKNFNTKFETQNQRMLKNFTFVPNSTRAEWPWHWTTYSRHHYGIYMWTADSHHVITNFPLYRKYASCWVTLTMTSGMSITLDYLQETLLRNLHVNADSYTPMGLIKKL